MATVEPRAADARELGRLMLGRELDALRAARSARGARAPARRLALRALSRAGPARGERAPRARPRGARRARSSALAGIDGNGQRELEEVLAGVRRAERRPRSRWTGEPTRLGARALRARGVAHLSGDRERAGLVAGMSVAENLVLKGSYDDRRFFRRGRFDAAAARRVARGAHRGLRHRAAGSASRAVGAALGRQRAEARRRARARGRPARCSSR